MMHSIRPRALIGGTVSGVLLCAVTPFANRALKTTPMAGGHFPLAAFVVFMVPAVLLHIAQGAFGADAKTACMADRK